MTVSLIIRNKHCLGKYHKEYQDVCRIEISEDDGIPVLKFHLKNGKHGLISLGGDAEVTFATALTKYKIEDCEVKK